MHCSGQAAECGVIPFLYQSELITQGHATMGRTHSRFFPCHASLLPSDSQVHPGCRIRGYGMTFPVTHPKDSQQEPDLNIDRGMSIYDKGKAQRYEALAKQLAQLVSEAQASFDAFLKALKKHGHV